MLAPHIVVMVQETVEDSLSFLLTINEVIHVRKAVPRLVAVAVVANETRHVVGLISAPRLGEQRVQLAFGGTLAAVERHRPFGVVGSKEQGVPGISFAVLISEVGIVGLEVLNPRAVGNLSAPEARLAVEQRLVVHGAPQQLLLRLLLAQLAGDEGRGIIVVGILHGLRHRRLVLVPGRHVRGVLLRNPSLAQVLVQVRSSSPTRPEGIII